MQTHSADPIIFLKATLNIQVDLWMHVFLFQMNIFVQWGPICFTSGQRYHQTDS